MEAPMIDVIEKWLFSVVRWHFSGKVGKFIVG